MNLLTVSALLACLATLGPGVRAGTEETNALLYLSKYGYISNNDGKASQVKEENIKDFIKSAVKDFQAFAGLNETGELDPVTVELMGTPRCGVRDRGVTARPAANSRNSQQQPQWPGHTGCSRMI